MNNSRQFHKDDGAARASKSSPKVKDTIVHKDGQYKYPGQVTKIPSGNITMQGVPYPVYGVDNLGNSQMMLPNMDYTFPGQSVTEYPMIMYGGDPSLPNITGHYPFGGRFTKTHTHMQEGGVSELDLALNAASFVPGYIGMGASALSGIKNAYEGDWTGVGLDAANLLSGGLSKWLTTANRAAKLAKASRVGKGLSDAASTRDVSNYLQQQNPSLYDASNSFAPRSTTYINTPILSNNLFRKKQGGWLDQYQTKGEVKRNKTKILIEAPELLQNRGAGYKNPFTQEAEEFKKYITSTNPNENVEIIPYYFNPDQPNQLEQYLQDSDADTRLAFFAHHGSKLFGRDPSELGKALQKTQYKNCYAGSCSFEDIASSPEYSSLHDFYYRPDYQWFGVNPNPNPYKGEEGIKYAMYSTVEDLSKYNDYNKQVENERVNFEKKWKGKNIVPGTATDDYIGDYTPEYMADLKNLNNKISNITDQQHILATKIGNPAFGKDYNILNPSNLQQKNLSSIKKNGGWLDNFQKGGTYNIKSGDTLYDIARKYNTSVAELVKLNKISNPDEIFAGQTLTLPTRKKVEYTPSVARVALKRQVDLSPLGSAAFNLRNTVYNKPAPKADPSVIIDPLTKQKATGERYKILKAARTVNDPGKVIATEAPLNPNTAWMAMAAGYDPSSQTGRYLSDLNARTQALGSLAGTAYGLTSIPAVSSTLSAMGVMHGLHELPQTYNTLIDPDQSLNDKYRALTFNAADFLGTGEAYRGARGVLNYGADYANQMSKTIKRGFDNRSLQNVLGVEQLSAPLNPTRDVIEEFGSTTGLIRNNRTGRNEVVRLEGKEGGDDLLILKQWREGKGKNAQKRYALETFVQSNPRRFVEGVDHIITNDLPIGGVLKENHSLSTDSYSFMDKLKKSDRFDAVVDGTIPMNTFGKNTNWISNYDQRKIMKRDPFWAKTLMYSSKREAQKAVDDVHNFLRAKGWQEADLIGHVQKNPYMENSWLVMAPNVAAKRIKKYGGYI